MQHLFIAWKAMEGSLVLINVKPPFNDTIAPLLTFYAKYMQKLIYEKSLTDFQFWSANNEPAYTGWAQSKYDKFYK